MGNENTGGKENITEMNPVSEEELPGKKILQI